MKRLGLALLALLGLALIAIGIASVTLQTDRAVFPAEADILNADRLPPTVAYDVMGRSVQATEAEAMLRTEDGKRILSAANGAVRIDAALAAAGRRDFYRETYGNEVFLTEVLGILDGALSVPRLATALFDLGGRGTTDLKVRLAREVTLGERTLRAGDEVSTGLQVPKGEFLPLGIRVFYDRGRIKVGATCALCHAAVDPASGRVVEGAPNTQLRIGLLLALSSNPSAYFAQTGIATLDPYLTRPENIVRTSKGPSAVLPDADALARDVRAMLAAWPPGSFDSTIDRSNNPTSIPSTFTAEAYPYGWSGHAALGPFRGLWSLGNINHGLHLDPIAQAEASQRLLGVDPEVYLGTLMQAAASGPFRFNPRDGRKPSEVLWEVDPTQGTPGFSRVALTPSFPRSDYLTANGIVAAHEGEPGILTLDRLATRGLPAFQNSLRPPTVAPVPAALLVRGRAVFERAGCLACHSGPALTSHRVWPAAVIGTEPTRAQAFARFEAAIAAPQIYAPDTPVPPPGDARVVDVPVPDEGQLKLAWGHNRTGGGYKVANLIGLRWTAPYLHDGGVAMGPDPDRKAGIAATAVAGISPDPANSLRALVDRTWRARVVEANRASAQARLARVTGDGHAFWVDGQAGYPDDDREALVAYLLSIDRPERAPAPPGLQPGAR